MSEMGIYKVFDELKKKEEGYDAIVQKFGSIERALEATAEEDVLKFYYCESEDKYLVGQRVDTRYYAEVGKTGLCFRWSRHLPWGEHVVASHTVWKEHTYPSEPKEIPFFEWLQGYIAQIRQEAPSVDAAPVVHGEWVRAVRSLDNDYECNQCGCLTNFRTKFCPDCGAYMWKGLE